MDDIIILHPDPQYLAVATLQIAIYLQSLGWTINLKKSELTPLRTINQDEQKYAPFLARYAEAVDTCGLQWQYRAVWFLSLSDRLPLFALVTFTRFAF
jgi:hypothetical protein